MKGGAALWDQVDALVGVNDAPPKATAAGGRRRAGAGTAAAAEGPQATLSLVRQDGSLHWVYEPSAVARRPGRARRAGGFDYGDREVVKTFHHADIGPNQITQGLEALDRRLTPDQGLRQWRGGRLQPLAGRLRAGRTLLLVHGTFSHSGMWFEQLGAADHAEGRALLAQWAQVYGDNVLAFDHPTLSVGPWLNALDLQAALATAGLGSAAAGPIDIVCHSRGGLVVAWLLRLAALPVRQVVFVGSPLAGTSLASPHRLRAVLDLLANVAHALALAGAAAGTVLPLAAGAAGLAKLLGKTLKLGAALPLADAAVVMVPGLASQQRTSNNAEMARLFAQPWLTRPAFHAVTSAFEPDAGDPLWKFWTRFRQPGLQLAHLGADLVFPGANDLVVDTGSMDFLGAAPGPVQGRPEVLALGPNTSTHHTNYLRNARVVGLLAQRLG